MKPKRYQIVVFELILALFAIGCSTLTDKTAFSQDANNSESKLEKITMRSEALHKDMNMDVYLPAGYNNQNQYPVLYLIHGYGENEDSWMYDRNLIEKADELIENSIINPLIIVSPQVDNDFGYGKYEDYIYEDIVSYIDSHYSTQAERESRYIGGVSMGGNIALRIAFLHSDLFSKAGGHSPALFVDADSSMYPNLAIRRKRDPIYIAEDAELSDVKVYLDCGDKDDHKFYEGCEELFTILQQKGVDSEYHLYPGTHQNSYWIAHLDEYLKFYDSGQ